MRIERAYRLDAEREQQVLRRFIRLAQEAVDQSRDKRETENSIRSEQQACAQPAHAPAQE